MHTLEEVLNAARNLPDVERRRLIAELEEDTSESTPEPRRQEAMSRWLGRAGTGHSDFADVSSNKNEHLTAVYATKS